MEKKSKVEIIELIKKTSGGMHAWYWAQVKGEKIKVRKPLTPKTN